MAPELTIERANSDDIDAVTELWVRLARGQREHDSFIRAEPNRETMRETLAAYQVADGLLVARADDRVVGFASYSIERGTLDLDSTRGTLSNLYVEPAYREQGIGTTLLETAADELAAKGAAVLTIEVMADNEAARRFYREQGYESYRVAMKRSLVDRTERAEQSERTKGRQSTESTEGTETTEE